MSPQATCTRGIPLEHQVTISQPALEAMVLAAAESYVLGGPEFHGPVEVHGYLWGNRRTVDEEDMEYIHIDRFSVSSSAPSDEDSVRVDKRVARIKNSVLQLWAPHLHFLGDFHTHPYETREEVEQIEGWGPSKQDRKVFRRDKDAWRMASGAPPIMVIMAVAKMQNVHHSFLKVLRLNTWRFSVGELRFWLSVSIGKEKVRRKKKAKRSLSNEDVVLYPQSWRFNAAGSRLDGV